MYTPATKRRRISFAQAPRNRTPYTQTDDIIESLNNQPCAVLRQLHQHVPNHTHMNVDLTTFKSQLQDVLQSFPPFADFIASHTHPDVLFNELYHVFATCPTHTATPSNLEHLTAPSRKPPLPPQYDDDELLRRCAKLLFKQQNITKLTSFMSTQLREEKEHNHQTNQHQNNPQCPTDSVSLNSDSPPPLPPMVQHAPLKPSVSTAVAACAANYDVCVADPNCVETFNVAKDLMMQQVWKNMDIRCTKLIESLNKTSHNNDKCHGLRKQFTMDTQIQKKLTEIMAETVKSWDGGKPLARAVTLTKQHAFKLVRGRWNGQKATQLGDTVFSLVLQNLFEIVVQIQELNRQEKALFYIDLFCGLLLGVIHFQKSKPHPIIPSACFNRSIRFMKLCQNILDSFSSSTLRMVHVEMTETIHADGKRITQYVKNNTRSKFLAESYFKSLQYLRTMITSASDTFLQHSMQTHLNWMRTSGCMCDVFFVLSVICLHRKCDCNVILAHKLFQTCPSQ
eukprot:91738_1